MLLFVFAVCAAKCGSWYRACMLLRIGVPRGQPKSNAEFDHKLLLLRWRLLSCR
jgi:hypothetical protein